MNIAVRSAAIPLLVVESEKCARCGYVMAAHELFRLIDVREDEIGAPVLIAECPVCKTGLTWTEVASC